MSENFTKMLEFMSLVGHLKHVRRTGWVQKKVAVGGGPESVADHMYRMAVLSFLVDPGAGLDKHRCMKIALVHDMAECIVGDITPQDGISKENKHQKEKTAMKHICSLVEESVGQEIYSLWQENSKLNKLRRGCSRSRPLGIPHQICSLPGRCHV
ncbi:5'-deoxynucleotidase HDDC2-like isoform X3 [Haliotis cracherodii]|uniref:5'-deoxynucleotidase HDDC2-like isoform X3 n=1 Tax=Haliotis cracherodii TaxID=6455 RepID=UPI0039E856A7